MRQMPRRSLLVVGVLVPCKSFRQRPPYNMGRLLATCAKKVGAPVMVWTNRVQTRHGYDPDHAPFTENESGSRSNPALSTKTWYGHDPDHAPNRFVL